MIERVRLDPPLSPMQLTCVTLAALGMSYPDIAQLLGIAHDTVAMHIKVAARKIPGDLPNRLRVIAWARGATIDVLEGTALKVQVMNEAKRAPISPFVPRLPEAVAGGVGSSA